MPHIIYLHGFLSSPSSLKAQQTKEWLADHRPDLSYQCPILSSYPREAVTQLYDCVANCDCKPYLIGSSLGGFWASHLIEKGLAEKAVLVNPAVSPHRRFGDLVGVPQQSYYSNDVYTLTAADLDTLSECESETIQDASRYWVMLQTGDEVLDYRMAEARYSDANCLIEQGGNHSFVGFERHLKDIVSFFGI